MAQNKINVGIDLGTTNSGLAFMKNGEPTIQKTDRLTDTMPSVVGFNKKGSELVGEDGSSKLQSDRRQRMKNPEDTSSNVFSEFKRTMGTEKTYYSSNADQAFSSEELSSKVLQKLRSFKTNEDIKSAVVTVPAKFDIQQKDATQRAAKLAGLDQCELLQEPIAASMAYGLDTQNKTGFWVVFDFGGGTFDGALVKVEEGIMKVIDTEGDNRLGGKNLDYAVVDEVIIPYLKENFSIDSILADEDKKERLRDAVKSYAEDAKNQLSFQESYDIVSDIDDIPGKDDEGGEFELDITLTRERLREVIEPTFQQAIDMTKTLIERNNLNTSSLNALIPVGGPTRSPILQDMLKGQLIAPETSTDPMTAIATGAALYASTIDVAEDIIDEGRDRTKVQLDIGNESTSVETEEMVPVKILSEKTEGELPEKVYAEFSRGDGAWASGKVAINETGEVIEVQLKENEPNQFEVFLYDEKGDKLECEPDQFTIIQGITGTDSAATLPRPIGIEIDKDKSYPVFEPVRGLEKNTTLPAKGVLEGLETKRELRPGNKEDEIRVSIYQGEEDSAGKRAIYNTHVYDVVITGDDISSFLPEGSEVNLTIETDRSGRPIKLEADFPYLDHTQEIEIPEKPPESAKEEHVEKRIKEARATAKRLKDNQLVDQKEVEKLEEELEKQEKNFESGKGDFDRREEVYSNLQGWFRKSEELEDSVEWPNLENQIKQEFQRLEEANEEHGDDKTTQQVEELRKKKEKILEQKDQELGKELLEEMKSLHVQITLIYQLIGLVKEADESFDSFDWKDRHQARSKINEAKAVISENPTKERLHPIVVDIINLMPTDDEEGTGIGKELLKQNQ